MPSIPCEAQGVKDKANDTTTEITYLVVTVGRLIEMLIANLGRCGLTHGVPVILSASPYQPGKHSLIEGSQRKKRTDYTTKKIPTLVPTRNHIMLAVAREGYPWAYRTAYSPTGCNVAVLMSGYICTVESTAYLVFELTPTGQAYSFIALNIPSPNHSIFWPLRW